MNFLFFRPLHQIDLLQLFLMINEAKFQWPREKSAVLAELLPWIEIFGTPEVQLQTKLNVLLESALLKFNSIFYFVFAFVGAAVIFWLVSKVTTFLGHQVSERSEYATNNGDSRVLRRYPRSSIFHAFFIIFFDTAIIFSVDGTFSLNINLHR